MYPQPSKISLASTLTLLGVALSLGLLWLLNAGPATYAQSQPQALGSLAGVVRNGQGEPLSNITVNLIHYTGQYPARHASSDASGGYHFSGVFPGIYWLSFEDPEQHYAMIYYRSAPFSIDADTIQVSGASVTADDMALTVGGSISLTIRGNFPLSTSVYAASLYRQTATHGWAIYRSVSVLQGTNTLLFPGLATGNYRLCVKNTDSWNSQSVALCYNNVIPQQVDVLPLDSSDIRVQAGHESAITIDFLQTTQVEGTVVSPSGQSVANVNLYLSSATGAPSRTATTDENGHFSFDTLMSSTYWLYYSYYDSDNTTPYLPGFYPNYTNPPRTPNIDVVPSTHLNLKIKLKPQSGVTGKVSLPGGASLDSISMMIYRQSTDGSWLTPPCGGNCGSFQYDSATGSYTVTQLTSGNYRMGVNGFMFSNLSSFAGFYGGDSLESAKSIALATGENKDHIDITIGESAFESSISGVVTAGGEVRAGIEVGLFATNRPDIGIADLPLITTETVAQGRYLFQGLSLGTYRLGARDPNGIFATTFYTATDPQFQPYTAPLFAITETGVLSNINLAMPFGATIHGQVRTEPNQSAGGYQLQLEPISTPNPYPNPLYDAPLSYIDERSNADGSFEIPGVPPGAYYLRVALPPGNTPYPYPYPYQRNYVYYPRGSDESAAIPLVLEGGQSLDGYNIYFYAIPNTLLPMVSLDAILGVATPVPIEATVMPLPTEAPFPTVAPLPTATPPFVR